MRALLLGLALWQAGELAQAPVAAAPQFFRYRRSVALPAGGSGTEQVCAALDAATYAHGAEALKDVRLYREAAGSGPREVPYAITMSEAAEAESVPAQVLNAGRRGGKVVFDLAMPDRPYTDVVLDLGGENFIAAAEVTGSNAGGAETALGTFTLFDLTGQHLARSTTLHLSESRFALLHVAMTVTPAPGPAGGASEVTVLGASVPPSREAQTVYTAVAETTSIAQKGRKTVASFRLPAHVPVERVAFMLAPGYAGSFSRDVEVSAREGEGAVETVRGNIERVRLTRAGREIRQEQTSVPATLGANLQGDATVEVAVENGDDAPLPLASVRLEMRERKVCFPAPPVGSAVTLFYGDAALAAPVYDFARVLSLGSEVAVARLGAEELNPGYGARAGRVRSLTERHPEVLWVALLGVVCVLAVVATHSAKKMPR